MLLPFVFEISFKVIGDNFYFIFFFFQISKDRILKEEPLMIISLSRFDQTWPSFHPRKQVQEEKKDTKDTRFNLNIRAYELDCVVTITETS